MRIWEDRSRPVSVLIIADADPVRDVLESRLQQFGCEVLTCQNAELGIERAVVHLPDAILVCPNLVDVDSIEVCQQIRNQVENSREPVIVVIPRGVDVEATNRNAGAADRPIDLTQFAKAISILASSTSGSRGANDRLATQGLLLDRKAFRADIDGRELQLTVMEFRILWQLAQNWGDVLSRQELCPDCRNQASEPRCRSIDVHVRSLRIKLGEKCYLLETVRGIGYRMSRL